MATPNRAAKITKLVTALKKQFKPAPAPPKNRTLLEHLLLACLLEDSPHDEAEKALEALRDGYFDWNEVRVSTKRELAESMKGLVDPPAAAERLKNTLQSVFESVYAFDLEAMKKQNLGVSVKQLEKHRGVTPFVVAYVVQNALGGHAIPVNRGLMIAFETFEVVTPAEAKKHAVPGLERAVPKNKGVELGSVLHQLGVEIGRNPYGPKARKLLTDLDPSCKDRLPKRPPPPPKPTAKKAPKKDAKPAAAKPKTGEKKKPEAKEPAAKKPAATKPAAAKAPAKKTPVKKAAAKPAAKKPAKKKVVKKKVVKKKAAPPAKKPVKKKAKTTKKSASLRKKKPR